MATEVTWRVFAFGHGKEKWSKLYSKENDLFVGYLIWELKQKFIASTAYSSSFFFFLVPVLVELFCRITTTLQKYTLSVLGLTLIMALLLLIDQLNIIELEHHHKDPPCAINWLPFICIAYFFYGTSNTNHVMNIFISNNQWEKLLRKQNASWSMNK